MKKNLPRDSSVERILDRQMRLWESERVQHPPEAAPVRPNLTISRRPFSGAEELADRLTARLGWELYDRRIVDLLHQNDSLGKSVLESLDERLLDLREDWMYQLFVPGHTPTPGYVQRLSRLVFSIAMRGHAVILGRGANLIVPQQHRLAVLVCRSPEARLQRYQHEHGGTHEAAHRELARLDRERGDFVLRSFHRNAEDPLSYDLCVNLDSLSLEVAEDVIVRALEAKFPHLKQAAGAR